MKSKYTPWIVGNLILTLSCAYAAETINQDGFSTGSDNSLPSASRNTAIGWDNSFTGISGTGSLLIGEYNSNGDSFASLAVGTENILTNSHYSTVFGWANTSHRNVAGFIAGLGNTISHPTTSTSGYANIVLGSNNQLNLTGTADQNNIVLGSGNTSSVTSALVLGFGNIGQSYTVTLGTYAQQEADAALIVGRSLVANDRQNGLVVFRDGRVSIPGNVKLGSSSGIYFGSNPSPTISAAANGSAIFPSAATFSNGLSVSNGTLSIGATTLTTSSGKLLLNSGIEVSGDSWINGVRIGRGAGNQATNTALGSLALNANILGTGNTAIGANALALATGSSNTALGLDALSKLTTGNGNTSIGARALKSATTGLANTAVGTNSMQATTTGLWNSAFGLNSLYYNESGGYNVAIGSMSLYRNTTGSYNIALGRSAGNMQANGTTPLTDPESSIYIGHNVRGFDNNDSNSIVIGADAIGEGANTTVLGNTATTSTRVYGAIKGGGALAQNGSVISLGNMANASANGSVAVGAYSVASGVNSTAFYSSLAFGNGSLAGSYGEAYGVASTAFSGGIADGDESVALGSYSYTMGAGAFAAVYGSAFGDSSVAICGANANANSSIAIGMGSTANANSSLALMSGLSESSAVYSVAMSGGLTKGYYSFATGVGSEATSFRSTSLGSFTHNQANESTSVWNENESILTVGNGNDVNNRSNAITTLKNGQTTLTNKAWKANVAASPSQTLVDPPATTDSGGNALVVEGHTILKGKVVIEQAQGDISMGIYQ